jgi:integrase/recombinase XerD
MKVATSDLYHDCRFKQSKTQIFPAKIRVTYLGKHHYFSTGEVFSKADWKKMYSKRPGDLLKEKKRLLAEADNKAACIIQNMLVFNLDQFKRQYEGIQTGATLKSHFERSIAKLAKDLQIKSSRIYRGSMNSIEAYSPGITIHEINQEFLADYRKRMLANGKSDTLVSIYFRCLRAVLNTAKAKGEIEPIHYPFSSYKIKAARKKTLMLTWAQIVALVEYQTTDENKLYARDMWLMCYFCCGRNFADIARLKYEWIKGNYIEFMYRTKTRHSDENPEPVIVPIDQDIQGILTRRANQKIDNSTYVFPILMGGMSPAKEINKISREGQRINDAMAEIGQDVGFGFRPGLAYARGSFANRMKQLNIPLEVRSQMMAHKSILTTRIYEKFFPKEVTDDLLSGLHVTTLKAVS